MIRVVRVIDRLNVGGPARHVAWLSAGLDGEAFETRLFTGTVPPGEGDMSDFARAVGVAPHVIPEMSRELSWRDAVVVWKLFREFRRFRPHIVHTHKAKAGAVGRTAAMLYKWLTPSALWLRPRPCAVVHTYHGHTFHSYFGPVKTRLFLWIERTLARFGTDRIVTISPQQRTEIQETFGVGRAAQFIVIPLGLDLAAFAAGQPGRLRRELGIDSDEPLVGIVGRLCKVKNHALFLDASAALVRDRSPARFVIVGDGELRGDLEARARELALADRLYFTGFRDDVASLYFDLDLVALTSRNEGTPLTLIEAMSAGCPVVATDVGGVVDLLGAKRDTVGALTIWDHGITTPSGDAAAFSHALNYLIERPQLRREMGDRGRAFIRSRYSKTRLIADIEHLYHELLGAHAARVRPQAQKASSE
jgi:glycosyltransferase involved in cell wall biosynthesis